MRRMMMGVLLALALWGMGCKKEKQFLCADEFGDVRSYCAEDLGDAVNQCTRDPSMGSICACFSTEKEC